MPLPLARHQIRHYPVFIPGHHRLVPHFSRFRRLAPRVPRNGSTVRTMAGWRECRGVAVMVTKNAKQKHVRGMNFRVYMLYIYID